jgi:heterodisulfide reductase subunit A
MIQSNSDVHEAIPTILLKQDVLILGGGFSGISLAEALVRAGVHVTIVEQGISLGGGASKRRLLDDRSEKANRLDGISSRLEKSENITILTQTELVNLQGHFGSFRAKVRKNDGQIVELTPAIIVAANGYLTLRQPQGIPATEAGTVYLPDMEKLIDAAPGEKLFLNGKQLSDITFLLDAVNDDIKLDSINVLEQAIVLGNRFNCQVSVLCRDLKVSFDGGERLYRKAREEGVLFFKYAEPPNLRRENGKLSLSLPDATFPNDGDQREITLTPDVIVLPETCLPGLNTDLLARILRIPLGKGGYLMEDNPQFLRIRSARRGIYVTGACRFPQELTETQREAEAAAQEIISILLPGHYDCGPVYAEVDTNKCALCYTCPRLCPHSAITIEKYAKQNIYRVLNSADDSMQNAARVEPSACYGCGLCVAECPAQAISLRGETITSINQN